MRDGAEAGENIWVNKVISRGENGEEMKNWKCPWKGWKMNDTSAWMKSGGRMLPKSAIIFISITHVTVFLLIINITTSFLNINAVSHVNINSLSVSTRENISSALNITITTTTRNINTHRHANITETHYPRRFHYNQYRRTQQQQHVRDVPEEYISCLWKSEPWHVRYPFRSTDTD